MSMESLYFMDLLLVFSSLAARLHAVARELQLQSMDGYRACVALLQTLHVSFGLLFKNQ
jgi:hypothetical protein